MSQTSRLQNIRTISTSKSPRGRFASHSRRAAAPINLSEPILLYGWDSRSQTWHGPDELSRRSLPDRQLLQALRFASGKSWYGLVKCCNPGEPTTAFFALMHDLSDCAVASIYCHESRVGPAEILAVIPSARRSHLRDDFPFEFVAFARFLGAISAGAELQVHDAIASAVADQRGSNTVVFSINSGLWPGDFEPVVGRCVEKVAVTLCRWLEDLSASRIGNT